MKARLPLLLCGFWYSVIFFCGATARADDLYDFSPPVLEWSDELYEKYDYESFEKLKVANRRIDMVKIDYPLLNAAVFYETNRQRVENGKSALQHSRVLEKAASGHSSDMVNFNFFSHVSPLAGKKTMYDRIRAEGIKYGSMGENLADVFCMERDTKQTGYSVGSCTPQGNFAEEEKHVRYSFYLIKGRPVLNQTYVGLGKEVVRLLMGSPGHRKNILSEDYRFLGVGSMHYRETGKDGFDKFKITQNFSRSAEKRFRAAPVRE